MALIRNIGSIGDTGLSDTDILLNAYNSGNGAVQEAPPLTIPVMQVATGWPVSGGNVDGAPLTPGMANVAQVDAAPDSGQAEVNLPLLIAGLGALYLFAGGGKTVSGLKKKSLVIPAVIVGGVGLWWYMSKKGTSSTATTDTTAASPQINATRENLLTLYEHEPKLLSAATAADANTIRIWGLLVDIWTRGADPYAVDTNGTPTANRAASAGAWWENFSKQQNF